MPLIQTDRLMAIKTPLPPNLFGQDALVLNGFTGQEGLSRLSRFDLDLIGEGDPINFEDIIGQRVNIELVLESDETRYFNGFISSFMHTQSERGLNHYRAEMVPWLWFLTRSSSCRIFPIPHQQAVEGESEPDDTTKVIKIIERVFKESGFTDYRIHEDVNGIFDPREFCVQYRESAFNFVSRLMEQYGIFYYFEHEKDKHTLVLGNTPGAHQTIGGVDLYFVHYEPTSRMLEHDAITKMEFEKNIRPGKFTHGDFNFSMNPTSRRLTYPGETTEHSLGGNERYEIYDYPAEVENRGQLEALGKIRMESEEVQHYHIGGRSTCRLFSAGYSFSLTGYTPDTFDDTYLLTSVNHSGSMGTTYTSGAVGGGESYSNSFSCIPLAIPFRPRRKTPKPAVQGPQTAIVVGPEGEEIWCDQYGRIKVQFHWDRDGQLDEESSCFVRVSQIWAGKNWGAQFIPRIGHEVIVEFIEGDPDRPIVTGCVYNEENKPPYDLPANQTQSGIKTRSSKEGTPNNFNEIRFEDKKGSEELALHAEKNLTTTVEADEVHTVGKTRTRFIGKGGGAGPADLVDALVVYGQRLMTVNGEYEVVVGVDGGRGYKVRVDNGDYILEVKNAGNINNKTDSGTVEYKSGANTITIDPGKIELKVGGSTINMIDGVITISSGKINIVSGDNKIKVDGSNIHLNANFIDSESTGDNLIQGAKVIVKGDPIDLNP